MTRETHQRQRRHEVNRRILSTAPKHGGSQIRREMLMTDTPETSHPPDASKYQRVSPDQRAEMHRLLTLAEPGAPVFDADNQNIGVVKVYDAITGYLTIGKGGFISHTYIVPARLITS